MILLNNKRTPNKNRALFACVFTSEYPTGPKMIFEDITLLRLHEMKAVKA